MAAQCRVAILAIPKRGSAFSPRWLRCSRTRGWSAQLISMPARSGPGSVLIAVSALHFLYEVSLEKDWTFEDVVPAGGKDRGCTDELHCHLQALPGRAFRLVPRRALAHCDLSRAS